MEAVRLNKFLSEMGYCSRRQADALVDEGRISVNNQTAVQGMKVTPEDRICVDGKELNLQQHKRIYIAFHKPRGVVCTTNSKVEKNNIIDYINYPERIYPIGRLDKESEGLILLTNDGSIVNTILKARHFHEKEYEVEVHKPVTADFVEQMQNGVPILDTVTRPCRVKQTGKTKFTIILTQGLNRQIRRMCEALNYQVLRLKRVRVMHIKLDVALGKWRHLSAQEVKKFRLPD